MTTLWTAENRLNARPASGDPPSLGKSEDIALRYLSSWAKAPNPGASLAVQFNRNGVPHEVNVRYGLRRALESELRIFREWSEGDPNIAASQDGLDRERLYAVWFKIDPNAFWVLEETLEDGTEGMMVGVSIVLGLSEKGYGLLSVDRVSAGVLEVSSLNCVVPKGPLVRHVLFDTLIRHPNYNLPVNAYVYTLALRHLVDYWNPDSQLPEELSKHLLIEPDYPRLQRAFSALPAVRKSLAVSGDVPTWDFSAKLIYDAAREVQERGVPPQALQASIISVFQRMRDLLDSCGPR